MVFALASLITVVVVLMIRGVIETRRKVHRFYEELDRQSAAQPQAGYPDGRFTDSLLALDRIHEDARDKAGTGAGDKPKETQEELKVRAR